VTDHAHGDESVLARLVGPATLERGRAYAEGGAVRMRTWSMGGTRVVGEVQGTEPAAYYASVALTRTPSGRLSGFLATCTCPVGANCKHAVALVLAGDPVGPPGRPRLRLVDSDPGPHPDPARPVPAPKRRRGQAVRTTPEWELPLQALITSDDDGGPGQAEPAGIGLQFEVVDVPVRDARGPTATRGTRPGIRIRPVMPGRGGNWVRSGISWGSFNYLPYRQPKSGPATRRLLLLEELLALSRLASRQPYSSRADEVVRLEDINSRRLWDLLREAGDLRLPLLQAGRPTRAVTLHASLAAVTLDVTRDASGLRLQPHVAIDDELVPLDASLLIGAPAHGIAWWDRRPSSTERHAGTRLQLAALATSVDESLRGLLAMGSIGVPHRDEPRFVEGLLPALRRRVAVHSSDPSVELPEEGRAILVLSVHYGDGHRITLRWARGVEGTEWREPLWGASGSAPGSNRPDLLVESATAAAATAPRLLEWTPSGPRLAPEVRLEGMDAARFAAEALPAIAAVDGVLVEQSGPAPGYREVVAAPVVRLGGSESGDHDWFDLTVTVTVGGEEVPFADLFVALADDQSHLILPSGTYFSLDRQELRELAQLIAEASALLETSGDGIRIGRFQASLWEDLCRLGVVTAQAGEWERSIRSLAEASDLTPYPAPEGLHAELRPYQHTGFNWLAYLYEHRLGGILADDMGLGKTLQALALMCHTRERGLADTPYLVVAPTSVVGNWAAECRRFTPGLRAVTVTETGRRRGTTLTEMAGAADLVITSYSLFRLDYEEYRAVAWAGLFLDEAQFAKNRSSQAYQRARLLPVPFKVAMTGTPIENNLMELWSLLSIAAPGLFPSPERFGEYYRVPIERQDDTERLAQLRRRVRPLMLRRTKEQVEGDLPEKQEQVLELELNPRHKRIYQTHLQRERQKVLGLLGDLRKNRFAIFTSLTLLRQASLDASLIDAEYEGVPSTKLDALMEMLDDIVEDGHRVLVFSQFTRFLSLARHRTRAAGIEHCYLDGRTRRREAVIAEFRQGKAPVFFISLKAGGFGLNLTEADYCILLDPWWNPATEAQAVDRVHRIGQTRKVMVYRLVATDTIEEKVMALKAKKSALFASVMDAGGFESGAMSADDIRGLLD
jgi:superfamily II DNA or RNA helicase